MALKSCAWLKCKALRRMSKRNHCNDPCMHMYIHIDISDSTTPMAAFVNGLHTSSPSALPASGVVSGAHERSHISQIDFMEPVVWHDGSCGPHGLGAAATMSLVSKVPDKSKLLFQGAMFMAGGFTPACGEYLGFLLGLSQLAQHSAVLSGRELRFIYWRFQDRSATHVQYTAFI